MLTTAGVALSSIGAKLGMGSPSMKPGIAACVGKLDKAINKPTKKSALFEGVKTIFN